MLCKLGGKDSGRGTAVLGVALAGGVGVTAGAEPGLAAGLAGLLSSGFLGSSRPWRAGFSGPFRLGSGLARGLGKLSPLVFRRGSARFESFPVSGLARLWSLRLSGSGRFTSFGFSRGSCHGLFGRLSWRKVSSLSCSLAL